MKARSTESFWAITSYFNPVGYQRRLPNYRAFRKYLAVPLVTLELSFDGRFELTPEDAEILAQVQSGDVLWQKERLLNLALGKLPEACDKIAWLDCDVVFEREDWVEAARRALDRFPLVHLFEERHDLPRDVAVDQIRGWNAPASRISIVHRVTVDGEAPDHLYRRDPAVLGRWTNGLAWASRREVLAAHGFYDACIVGSGDLAMIAAALGALETAATRLQMNPPSLEHYRAWAQPYYEAVRGRVSLISGRLFHLWHGELEDRQYSRRHSDLAAFDFDPSMDIALDSTGCWRWNSAKPALHAYVRRYFEARQEDGASGGGG